MVTTGPRYNVVGGSTVSTIIDPEDPNARAKLEDLRTTLYENFKR
jgi:hypothetical protein